MRARSRTDEISDRYVERFAALHPVGATMRGITGHDDRMTDYSPDGIDERTQVDGATLADLHTVEPGSARERVALGVMTEQLERNAALADAGEHLRSLNVLASPMQHIRACFDLVPTATIDDFTAIAARLAQVPAGIDGYRSTLQEGIHQGIVAARRQAEACARQADTWGGVTDTASTPFFHTLVERFDAAGLTDSALRAHLVDGADRATRAYAAFGRFLVDEYLPHAAEHDGVGEDRYALWARAWNGLDLDLHDTYAWGWDELHRIERAMQSVAERILPGRTVPEVIDHLEHDPTRSIEGVDAFRAWNQELLDTTVAALDGVHFDIPDPVKRVEAMIAPPGGAAAMYYTGPAEDFSRPGRTWYPTLGRTVFPLWGEVSICYHEGVPGHHLQIAQVRYLADVLTRYQRTLAGSSGHAEGWALYAERLMGELGYLEDPAYELGMLRAQAMRAVRVIVDIGLHLSLRIPDGEAYLPGEVWTPASALPFVITHSYFPADFMASEVDRYLGLPGQAISYKVGEREWLAARDDARRAAGADFDLKAFHAHALDLGPMGLEQLRRELAAPSGTAG
ncbi:MAG: DUF885 domain-containing protein [Actinobacteria bacterium]|nr:DUF885 domain-containing protein [Actinomycetota bacterium]